MENEIEIANEKEVSKKVSSKDIDEAYTVIKEGMKSVSYDKFGNETINTKERRECACVILTMAGHLKAKTDEVNVKVTTIQLGSEDVEKLSRINRELDELNKRLGREKWQMGEAIDSELVTETNDS